MTTALKNTFFALCFLLAGVLQAAGSSVVDSLMCHLDSVIAGRERFLAAKEERLALLHDRLREADSDREIFDVLGRLYEEYHPFNADSAYDISMRQQAVANRIGDSALVMNAMLNRANILSATGMYHEVLELMDSVSVDRLPDYLHGYYYHIMRTGYGRLADYAAFGPEKARYDSLTNMYCDSIMAANPPGTLAHVITMADRLNVSDSPRKAVDVLKEFMESHKLSEHERAICAWTLSEAYARLGDKTNRKEQLLVSAIADMKSSVREYVSLRQLAILLYEEGDLDRAYDFMTIAVDDAAKCNARQRIIELNDTYPKINGIYIDTVREQKRALEWTILIITVLSLILLAMLLYMRKQMLKIARARKETERAYAQLNKLTDELRASNEQLSYANSAIAEISELKDVYIGKYMDQCLVYIEKLDSYRKSIGKLFNSGKSDDLKKLLKSTTVIDDELKLFYDQFDKTFLNIFPTFVEDFNRLLQPDECIIPKKEGSLNTELRIFALIRLGISDSDKIARFLRYSITTIYNYRTKVRNKALGDRNHLEVELMNIGRNDRSSD